MQILSLAKRNTARIEIERRRERREKRRRMKRERDGEEREILARLGEQDLKTWCPKRD